MSDLSSIVAHVGAFWSYTSSILLLLVSPFRIRALHPKKVKVIGKRGKHVKLLCSFLVLISRFVASVHSSRSKVTLAVHLTAALALCALSSLEHSRSLRPSTLITSYLLTSLISDVADAVSRPTIHSLFPIACEIVFLIVESQSKGGTLKPEYNNIPAEALTGALGRSMFCWVNDLIFNWRTGTLTLHDLPKLDAHCSSSNLRKQIVQKWAERAKPETKFTFLLVVWSCIRMQLLQSMPSRLMLIIFRYAQPVLIEIAINYASQRTATPRSLTDGRCIVFLASFIYIGMALSSSVYQHALNRMKVMVRGALIGLIHDKVLSKRGAESKMQNEKAIAFIGTDVDSLANIAEMIQETWAQLIEVVLGLSLLTKTIGWISPVLLLSIFACSQVSRYVAKHLAPRQRAWNEATQRRMTVTTEVVNQAKTVRMAGLTDFFSITISELRKEEIEISKSLRWVLVYYNASANALGIMSPVIVLMLYAFVSMRRDSSTLDVKTAFTSTALLALVTHPANMMMTIIPRAVAAQVGFERLQSFLLERDAADDRIVSPSGTTKCRPEGISAVRIEKATVHFTSDSPPILKEVDCNLNHGCATLCLGGISSGKSALVRAILGDMKLSTGSIEVSTQRIAVCMQTPWLPNGTVQQAICGMATDQHYDSDWYDTVIRACCLDTDFKTLADSDATQIGYCGINLSGGQRQRVALARAVYSNCEIILLDDPLSSLDRTTEDRILHNLLGPRGLLRRHGVTTLFTSNTARHVPFADFVVALEDSNIKTQTIDSHSTTATEDTIRIEKAQSQAQLLSSEVKLRDRSQAVAEASRDVKRKVGDLGTYRHYFTAAGMTNCGLLAVCNASYSFFVTIPQYWLKCWTESTVGSAAYFIWGYFLLSFLAWVSTNGIMWTTHLKVATTSGAVLHRSLLRTTMGATSSFFFETDSAETLTRFGQDMNLVDKDLPPALGNLGTQIFKLMMQLGLLYVIQPKVLLVLPFGIGIIYLVQKVYLKNSRQLRLLDLERRAGIYSSFIETTEGLITIRSFGWEDQCAIQHCRYLDDCQRPFYMMMCLQRWLNIVMDLFASGVTIIVVALLVRGTISGAQIGIALNIMVVMNTTLLRLIESWTNLEVTLGAISRLQKFQIETVQEDLPRESLQIYHSWPASGSLSIRNIQDYSSKAVALHDLSLDIKAGQKVIICGRTGSGKSTVLLALLRLLELRHGSIEVDGVNIANVQRSIVRSRCFITLPQDPLIMPRLSLRHHVDPEAVYTDQQIMEILVAAQIWGALSSAELDGVSQAFERSAVGRILDQPLHSLPSLSYGQMQLLCVARAALQSVKATATETPGVRRKPILLVDEATSSLDKESEELALELIDRYFTKKGFTVIMVTHKLDAVRRRLRKDTDMVVTMEAGRIQKIERVR